MLRKISIAVLAIVATITGICIVLISQLGFDYDFEKFFPNDHPETVFYKEFRKEFTTDNDFVVIGLVNDQGTFDQNFLSNVDSLTSILQTLPNVEEVLSPTRLEEIIRDPVFGSIFRKQVLRWREPENYAIDSTSIYNNTNYVGTFFSADKKTVAIHLQHKAGISKALCDKISYDIEDALTQFTFDEEHVIGRALGQRIYVDMMVDELILFVTISALLTLLFLFIAFRTFWNVVLPILTVMISIVWTMGLMRLIGKDIDIMLTVLPTIIFVVGISDSVHILTRYLFELRNGFSKYEALRKALKSAGLATFLTSLTTAIGFGTLMFNSIQPISDFGIYTSIGVMLAYGITYVILPCGLLLTPVPKVKADNNKTDFWTKTLHTGFLYLIRFRHKILLWLSLISLTCMSGILLLDVNNYMLEDLQEDHLLKQEFRFTEEKLSGVRPFEMAIMLKENVDPFDPLLLNELEKIDTYLREEYGVGHLYSPVKLVKESWKTLKGGQEEFYRLPETPAEIEEVRKLLYRKELKKLTDLFISKETSQLRFSGKVGDLGRLYFEKKDESLHQFIQTFVDAKCFEYKLTGTAMLIDLNNTYLTENMLWSLLISVVVIAVLMGLLYRSIIVGLLSIIPNILPLAIVAGIMGFSGIHIKISTSIIFSIAFGIAVDDTIHYLAKLKEYIQKGYSLPYASKRTFITTGKAMIVTTIILCAGFVTLVFSDFMGTFYIGFLIGLTLILALLFDLILTPLLMLWIYKPSKLIKKQ